MTNPEVKLFFEDETKTATYVVWCPETKESAVIDSVMNFNHAACRTSNTFSEEVFKFMTESGLKLKYILETHVHADHMTGAQFFKSQVPDAKTGIGANVTVVQETFKKMYNLSDEFKCDGSQFDVLFNDGDTFKLGKMDVKVMHTPGHTPACVSYVVGDAVFTGDSLFMPDMGTARCDFPGGSAETLFNSIKKLYGLDENTRVFVGHDYAPGGREYAVESKIGVEKSSNKSLKVDTPESEFVEWRKNRDATLGAPRLILPSLQVNLRNGKLPEPESNGTVYLKLPVNLL